MAGGPEAKSTRLLQRLIRNNTLLSVGAHVLRLAGRIALALRDTLWRPIAKIGARHDRELRNGPRRHMLMSETEAHKRSELVPARANDEVTSEGSSNAADSTQKSAVEAAVLKIIPIWPRVDLVAVPATFDETSDATILQLLQGRQTSKMLDLRPAQPRALSVAWFERLAAGWQAPAADVPRLAVVLDLERWALWEATIANTLRPIADRGVDVRVVYGQQAHQLERWFGDGKLEENLYAVMSWVRHEWPTLRAGRDQAPSAPPPPPRLWAANDVCTATWARVLRRIAALVEQHASHAQVPPIRLELADIARAIGGAAGNTEALHHVSAALYWAGDAPSHIRCRLLRAQAAAKVDLLGTSAASGQHAADALQRLNEATEVALIIHDPVEAMHALLDGARYTLRWQLYARAEQRLRRALELARPEHPPELRADVHHLLARALLEQGNEEAQHHATAALYSRPDTTTPVADRDRALLAEVTARLSPPARRASTAAHTTAKSLPRSRSEGA